MSFGFKKSSIGLLLWDGFTLTAAIWQDQQIGPLFSFKALRLEQALTMLPDEFRKTKQLILAATGITTAWVDLPVNPYSPKSRADMETMVRWELEPLLEQEQSKWSLGAVLAARGSLSAEARHAVQLELELLGAKATPSHFGDLALKMGFIQREELELALKQQTILRESTTDVRVAYDGYHLASGHSLYGWLLAGISASRFSQWHAAFKQEGLKLDKIVPLAALAAVAEEGDRVSLEITDESVLAVLMVDGQVHGMRHEDRTLHGAEVGWVVDFVSDWLSPENSRLEVNCLTSSEPELLLEITQRCSCDTYTANQVVAKQMAVLGRIAAGESLPGRVVQIPLRNAIQLNWKDPAVTRWLFLAAGLLGLLFWCLHSLLSFNQVRLELQSTKAEWVDNRSNREMQTKINAELTRLYPQVKAAKNSLAESSAMVGLFGSLDDRVQLLPALIQVLSRVIGDDVVLNKLKEGSQSDGSLGVYVEAWSNTNESLQSFLAAVADGLLPYGFIVTQSQVVTAVGRSGTPGYQINFWLIPNSLKPEAKP